MATRDQVADSWRCDMPHRNSWVGAGTMRTDGKTVWSYVHVIGETVGDEKVARACKFSLTTRNHVAALKRVADRVVPCDECLLGSKHGSGDA